MTVETEKSEETYPGNGSSRNFSIPFRLDDNTKLKVYVTNKAVSPYSVTEILPSDYIVNGEFVTYPKTTSLSAISSTKSITIKRDLPLKQDTNFITLSGVYLERLEHGFDNQMMIIQQLNDKLSRAVLTPIGGGINPNTYLDRIELAKTQAQAAATVAQNATIDMPAVPFKEVFGIGGTNPFDLLQSHNGNLANASVGSGGLIVNLPKMDTLNFPYLTAVRRNSGTTSFVVNPASGDTIAGASSVPVENIGDVIIFVADDDSLSGNWTPIYCKAGITEGSVTESKIADLAVTTSKLDDGAVTTTKVATNAVGLTQLSVAVNNLLDGLVGNAVQDHSSAGSPYTLTTSTRGNLFRVNASSSVVYNLPVISSSVSPHVLIIKRTTGTSSITINAGSGNTIEGGSSLVMSTTVGDSVMLIADFSGAGAGNWTAILLPSASTGSGSIAAGSITSTELATDAVITTKITNLNVTGAKIADATITNAKLVDDTITGGKIAATTIAQGNMANSSIGTAQLIDDSVTNAKIGANSVGTTQLIDANVTGAKIAATTITQAKLANASVGTAQIIDANITQAKMATNSVDTGNLVAASVTASKIADGAITGGKIASGAVDTANIAASAITNTLLANTSVSNSKLYDNAVGTSKIIDANVTQAKLANGSVGTAQLIDSNITLAKLAANSVGTSQLVDSNVTQAKLESSVSSTLDNVFARDVLSISSSTTLSTTHKGCLVNVTASSTVTITLPTISAITGPFSFKVRRYSGASTITINRASTDTINHGTSTGLTTLNMTTTVGDWIEFVADFTGATANQWFTLA